MAIPDIDLQVMDSSGSQATVLMASPDTDLQIYNYTYSRSDQLARPLYIWPGPDIDFRNFISRLLPRVKATGLLLHEADVLLYL